MALLAYLMEHKNNYGPHLIIVPNAVMVNWKSELNQWLPTVRCVYYVGQKDERARKFAQEVSSLQFNVLVTTYEYIMRDRAKLSKVEAYSCDARLLCMMLFKGAHASYVGVHYVLEVDRDSVKSGQRHCVI